MVFHPLNKEHIRKIVGLMIKELAQRCKDQMDITLTVRDSVRNDIIEKDFDDKYGARPLRRAIQNKIEDALAEEILSGRVKAGDNVAVGKAKNGVRFYVVS